MNGHHRETVARRKLGDLPEGFAFCRFEAIGPDAVLMEGGVRRILSRGPRKGQRKWGKMTHKVVVTDREVEEERKRYEKETGICGACLGTGEEWAGWSRFDGDKFIVCRRCKGTKKVEGRA